MMYGLLQSDLFEFHTPPVEDELSTGEVNNQWHSHWRGQEGGQSATPDSEKFAKNWEKEGKNQEKRGKIRKKRQKLGRVFHFAPPDR